MVEVPAVVTAEIVEKGVESTVVVRVAEPAVVVEGLVATEEVVVLVEGTRIQTKVGAIRIMIARVTYVQIPAIFSTTSGN